MNIEDLQIVLEAKTILINASIEQLKENIQALKLADNIIKERDDQIKNLLKDADDVDHWRQQAYRLQRELDSMTGQRDRARDTAQRYIEQAMLQDDKDAQEQEKTLNHSKCQHGVGVCLVHQRADRDGTWCDCGC